MSLLPRRGPGRHGQPGGVAVHPGWTLTPTSVTEAPVYKPEHVREPAAAQPPARWTSTPAVPQLPEPAVPESRPEPEPAAQTAPEPAAPVATVVDIAAAPSVEALLAAVAAPHVIEPATAVALPPVSSAPAAAVPTAGWASEWEAVAATPTTPSAPLALHTAAVAALDAVFGTPSAPASWTAAPADLEPAPHPAPRPAPALTALDQPLPPADRNVATPLAIEAARAMPPAVSPTPTAPAPARVPAAPFLAGPVVTAPAVTTARPAPPAWPSTPAPPSTPPPPPRTTVVPSVAQQLMERAIRTAPTLPPQHRSTVRLGFTDASVIDLRPDDPIAKALHTVADALIGRDSS